MPAMIIGHAKNWSVRDRRIALLLALAIVLIAGPVAADPWYEHYASAEQALAKQDWSMAVEQLNAALEKKGDSGARVRSYGMNVIPYFPYLRLGIAYYEMGQLDAALQAFETETRLGAITQSDSASAELEHYRALARNAVAALAEEKEQRIGQIVDSSLRKAAELESRGQLVEAIAAVGQALSVAPDDQDAQAVMIELRRQLADLESQQSLDRRVKDLVEQGQSLLRDHRYGEASSTFQQALQLRADPAVQSMLDAARSGLLVELQGDADSRRQPTAVAAGLNDVRTLESRGQLSAALERLQSILVLDPDNREAQSIQTRLLQQQNDQQAENARREAVGRFLDSAAAQLGAGSLEDALAAANAALALDPGNRTALEYVAKAYGEINRRLLGAGPAGNIPPAVRFVDLRQQDEEGTPVQIVTSPDFRLNGVVIDDSPVEIIFYANDTVIEPVLTRQPLGDFYLTEFSVESKIQPGRSIFRLVATDSANMSSSSEYAVTYVRPFYRGTAFYFLILVLLGLIGAALLLVHYRHRAGLRKRRFNPYVAGAPVIDEKMFFGRSELVDRILQTIHQNSLLIYGERRIGKTSIQHQLKKRLRSIDDPRYAFYPVYIDLQGTPQEQFFRTMAEDIYQELAPELEGLEFTESAAADYGYRDFVRDIRSVIRFLQDRTSKTVKLVLLIDEVDALNEYDPRINQKLRSLFMKNFAENMVAVVSGVEIKKRWEREGSPWYNFFEEVEVPPFTQREARDLIERPVDRMFRLDGDAVDRIISLTGGRPYLIQKVCVALVMRLHEEQRRRITVADVDAVAGASGL